MNRFETALARPHAEFPGTTRLVIATLRDMLAARRERARIQGELEGYNDRQLADIGISRADIPAIAAGTYRR